MRYRGGTSGRFQELRGEPTSKESTSRRRLPEGAAGGEVEERRGEVLRRHVALPNVFAWRIFSASALARVPPSRCWARVARTSRSRAQCLLNCDGISPAGRRGCGVLGCPNIAGGLVRGRGPSALSNARGRCSSAGFEVRDADDDRCVPEGALVDERGGPTPSACSTRRSRRSRAQSTAVGVEHLEDLERPGRRDGVLVFRNVSP